MIQGIYCLAAAIAAGIAVPSVVVWVLSSTAWYKAKVKAFLTGRPNLIRHRNPDVWVPPGCRKAGFRHLPVGVQNVYREAGEMMLTIDDPIIVELPDRNLVDGMGFPKAVGYRRTKGARMKSVRFLWWNILSWARGHPIDSTINLDQIRFNCLGYPLMHPAVNNFNDYTGEHTTLIVRRKLAERIPSWIPVRIFQRNFVVEPVFNGFAFSNSFYEKKQVYWSAIHFNIIPWQLQSGEGGFWRAVAKFLLGTLPNLMWWRDFLRDTLEPYFNWNPLALAIPLKSVSRNLAVDGGTALSSREGTDVFEPRKGGRS